MTTPEPIVLPRATCEAVTNGDYVCRGCGASFSMPLGMRCDDHNPTRQAGPLRFITSPERDTYTAGTEYKLCSSLELIETPLGWKWVRRRAYGIIRLGEPVEIRYGLRSILDPPTGRWFCVMQHPMIDGRTYLIMQSCDGFGMTTSPSDQDQHGVPFTPGHWAWPVEVLS